MSEAAGHRMVRFPDAFPELRTERFRLRAVTEADADAAFAMHASPAVSRYLSEPPWTDPERARAWVAGGLAGFAERRFVRWIVTPHDDPVLIGSAVFFAIDRQCRRAEVGYVLAHEHWGRGVMVEALAAVLDWGFGDFGLHRVEADADPRNAGSCRLLERLGFTREGLLRERWIVAGEISDTAFYGLLEHEWRARRARG